MLFYYKTEPLLLYEFRIDVKKKSIFGWISSLVIFIFVSNLKIIGKHKHDASVNLYLYLNYLIPAH